MRSDRSGTATPLMRIFASASSSAGWNRSLSVEQLDNHPRRLKDRLLWSLLLVLCSLSTLVVVIWAISRGSAGFESTIFSQNTLTYTPTTLMLLVVAMWRQVDYGCKASAGWVELSKGQVQAPRSVLLDYISVFQAVSFYESIVNGHLPVSLSIFGFALLKLATIASTGLLVLRPGTTFEAHPLSAGTGFDGLLYNSSNLDLYQDQAPVFTAYGIMNSGLEYPFGTDTTSAYATFALPTAKDVNATFSTTVPALLPNITCQRAEASVELLPSNLTVTIVNPQHQLRLSSPSCDPNPGAILALNPALWECPQRQLAGTVYPIQCRDQGGSETDNWRIITVTDIEYPQILNASQKVGPLGEASVLSSSTNVMGVSSVVCRIAYTVGAVNVSGRVDAFPSGLSVVPLPSTTEAQMPNFTNDDLHDLLRKSLAAAQNIFRISDDDKFDEEVPNTLIQMMAETVNGSYSGLLDTDAMITAAQTTLTHIVVQAMGKYLRTNKSDNIVVSIGSFQQSIQVTALSAWLMFGSFIATTLIALVLLFIKDVNAPPTCARSLLAMAAVSRESTSLWPLLAATKRLHEKGVHRYLTSYGFCTTYEPINGGLAIAAVPSKNALVEEQSIPLAQGDHWWKQLSLSRWFLGSTFAYAAALLAILEGLQRVTDNNRGVEVPLSENELWKTAITHYLPALAVILCATLFNCLEFNVLLLQPYNKLRSGMQSSALQQPPPITRPPWVSFWNAFVKCDLAILGSSSAAFAGTLLTIVVSALFTIDTFDIPRQNNFEASDLLTEGWVNNAFDDGGAAVLTSLTQNLNLSFPQGTHDELAVPQLLFPAEITRRSDDFMAMVPIRALRANLTCETAGTGGYNVSVGNTESQYSVSVSSSYPLPESCLRGGPGGNESTLLFSTEFRFSINATESYVAKLLDLHVGPYDEPSLADSSAEVSPRSNPDNPPGCPSLALIYGALTSADLSQENPAGENIAVQVCYQEVESVKVNVTFEGQRMQLSTTAIPAIIESTTTKLRVPTSSETAFQFRLQAHFDNALAYFNDAANPYDSVAGEAIVDRFFQGLFFGSDRIPIETMKLLDGASFNQMQRSIKILYQRYMAQAISAKMRVEVSQLSDGEIAEHLDELSYRGDVVRGMKQSRLVQHNTPKLVLQGMIAFMMLGGILAVSTTKLIDVLPASGNPCTIWGQMSLWAGSRWCEDREGQSERDTILITSKNTTSSITVTTLKQAEERDNRRPVFQLGWWTTKSAHGELRRRYGIDSLD